MIAMTTSNSMRVNARNDVRRCRRTAPRPCRSGLENSVVTGGAPGLSCGTVETLGHSQAESEHGGHCFGSFRLNEMRMVSRSRLANDFRLVDTTVPARDSQAPLQAGQNKRDWPPTRRSSRTQASQ